MTRNKFSQATLTILISATIMLFVFYPYWLSKPDFLIGFDSGMYTYELSQYTKEAASLQDTISIWNEPGVFVITTILNAITGLESWNFIIIAIMLLVMLAATTRIYARKFCSTRQVIFISTFLTLLSAVQLNGIYKFFLKQQTSFVVFLVFLYFFTFYKHENKKDQMIHLILLGILSGFIIFSHRAISFLWIFVMAVHVSRNLLVRNWSETKNAGIIFATGAVLSAPYIAKIFVKNLEILLDFFRNSTSSLLSGTYVRQVLGDKLISESKYTNPLLDYLSAEPIFAIFGAVGLFILIKKDFFKKNSSYLIYITGFICTLAFLKFTFASRFILNLDFFLIILSTITLDKIFGDFKANKRLSAAFAAIIVLILVITITVSLEDKKPYLSQDQDINFILNNIPKGSIIFAPDYLQTVLAQQGHIVPLIYTPLNFNESGKEDLLNLARGDDFLAHGYEDLSLIKNYNLSTKPVYVAFGRWNVDNPLPRSKEKTTIPLNEWDKSKWFDKIYQGNHSVIRIYKLRSTN